MEYPSVDDVHIKPFLGGQFSPDVFRMTPEGGYVFVSSKIFKDKIMFHFHSHELGGTYGRSCGLEAGRLNSHRILDKAVHSQKSGGILG